MAEISPAEIPEGVGKKKPRISLVWVVPLVVILLGAGILYRTIRDKGVTITLTFLTADGLEAGKTKIKYKDVEIGVVDSIRVSDDGKHVVLEATLHKQAKDHLKETTRFWVVRPRVTLQGISGLGTLLSGAYINVDPGEGASTREFTGLEEPPVLALESDAKEFELHAEELGSVSVGSPVFYRGIQVGEVLSYELIEEPRGVDIKLFVRAPHHALVYAETQFWDVSGISASMGADGFDLKMASIESLLIGGIAFDLPRRVKKGTPAKEDTVFRLHERKADIDQYFSAKYEVVLYFEGSLRGLHVGAPVELHGIRIGEVTSLAVEFDREAVEFRMPVTVTLEPERLDSDVGYDMARAKRTLNALIENGLRGQLKSGSLITGELFVDLVMEPGTPARLVAGPDSELPEIPTIPSTMEMLGDTVKDVVAKLDGFVTKLDSLELEKMIDSATGALDSIQELAASKDLAGALKDARVMLQDLPPLVKELRKMVKDTDSGLTEVLDRASATLATVNGMLKPESPIPQTLTTALKELGGAARAIRSLVSYLERHPEALIKGK